MAIHISMMTLLVCALLVGCSEQQKGVQEPVGESQVRSPYPQEKRESTRYLAYEHTVRAEVDAERLSGLHSRLVERCVTDVEYQCVLLEANLQRGLYSNSKLRMRMLPGGVGGFFEVLDQQGKIQSRSSRADDLTEAVVDNKKHIEMLTKHRLRLEKLSDTESSDIDALLKIAKELASVQTQLEFATGKEQQYAKRVETDLLSIDLTSSDAASRGSVIGNAVSEFGDDLAYATASVISFTASLLPWLPVFILLIWALRWFWRFLRRKPA